MDICVKPPYSVNDSQNGEFILGRRITAEPFENIGDLVKFDCKRKHFVCQIFYQLNVYFNNKRGHHYKVKLSYESDLSNGSGYWLVASINQQFSFWNLKQEIKDGDGDVMFQIMEEISNNAFNILVRNKQMEKAASISVPDRGTENQNVNLKLTAHLEKLERMIVLILASLLFLRYYHSSTSMFTRRVTSVICIFAIIISFVLMSSCGWLSYFVPGAECTLIDK